MIDKQLDKIEILLLKISDDDQYKEDLFREYNLYRSALETVPRDSEVPSVLRDSVESFEQRLKLYIIKGKSNNPLEELVPTLTSKINSEEEKAKILKMVKTNISYLNSRRSQLNVFKAYLDGIKFDDESIEDIESTIKYVEQGYIKTNVYSNSFEQEIAKAKYFFTLKLICNGNDEKAKEIINTFDTDMILFIHSRHKETVKELLDKGKSKLAMELNIFLTEFPEGKERDIAFWKVLCEIEKPDKFVKSDIVVDGNKTTILNSEEKSISKIEEEEEIRPPKISLFKFIKSIFNKNTIQEIKTMPRLVSKEHFKVYFNDNRVEVTLYISKFRMNRSELDELVRILGNGYKRNENAFTNGIVSIYDEYSYMYTTNIAELGEIIRGICEYLHITKMDWYGSKSSSYEIKDGEFSGMYFEDLSIHKGSWKIGKSAFAGNIDLAKVNLYDAEISKIEDRAFSRCSDLTEIVMPIDTSEFVFGNGVFEDCKKFTTINWPYKVKRVNNGMFKNCIKLQDIGSNEFVEIGASAFEGCESFNKIYYANGIRKIGNKAFYKCKALTNFCFGDNVEIGSYAFAETGLTSVTVEFKLHGVGEGVFQNSMLESATINKSLTLPHKTFMGCKYLHRVKMDSFMTCLLDDCFNGCTSLEEIDLPELVGYLGARAFMNCKNLRKLELRVGCDRILEECFRGCTSLTKFKIPNVGTIEKGLFYECVRLEEVTFYKIEDVVRIDDKAFEFCERLTNFTIPPNVKSIGSFAFAGSDIKEAIIPESCRELGNGAFYECHRLENVQLSSYIRDIGSETFRRCFSLKEIDMSKCFIDTIGKQAFEKCESLSKISFGEGLRKIYKDTFDKCKMIEELVIPISLLGISKRDVSKLNDDYQPVYAFMDHLGIYEDYDIDKLKVNNGFVFVSIHTGSSVEKISTVEDNSIFMHRERLKIVSEEEG